MDFLEAIKNNNIYFLKNELESNVIQINKTIKDKRGKYVTTPLIKACEVGNKDIVDLFLKHNVDLNRPSQAADGTTPLHIACKNGHLEIVKLLAQNGAKINQQIKYQKSSPLHAAVNGEYTEIVRYLIERHADVNILGNQGTPLIAAAEQSNMTLAKLLLQNGANVNATSKTNETALHKSAEKQYISMIELFIQHKADINIRHHGKFTVPLTAIHYRKNESLKYLLTNEYVSSDVNAAGGGKTPLALAAETDNIEAMKLLLSCDAKVNLLPTVESEEEKESVNDIRSTTKTALMYACENCHRRPIELLLKNGAKVNKSNPSTKNTALHLVLFNSKTENNKKVKTCELLLQHKASYKLKNKLGVSPLYYAIRKQNLAIIEVFLKNGGDPNKEDKLEETALHRLIDCDIRFYQLLLKYRVDVNKQNLDGQTALHLAVMLNKPIENIELLLKFGALVTRNNNGEFPFHFANTFELLELFRRIGCNLNEQANNGDTTLHRIVKDGASNVAMLKACLETKIFELGISNSDNKTVHDIAKETSSFEIIKLFEEENKRDDEPVSPQKQQKKTKALTNVDKNKSHVKEKEDKNTTKSNNVVKTKKKLNKKPEVSSPPEEVWASNIEKGELQDDGDKQQKDGGNKKTKEEGYEEQKDRGEEEQKDREEEQQKNRGEEEQKDRGEEEQKEDVDIEVNKDMSLIGDIDRMLDSDDDSFEELDNIRPRHCSFYESSTSGEDEILYLDDEDCLSEIEEGECVDDLPHHRIYTIQEKSDDEISEECQIIPIINQEDVKEIKETSIHSISEDKVTDSHTKEENKIQHQVTISRDNRDVDDKKITNIKKGGVSQNKTLKGNINVESTKAKVAVKKQSKIPTTIQKKVTKSVKEKPVKAKIQQKLGGVKRTKENNAKPTNVTQTTKQEAKPAHKLTAKPANVKPVHKNKAKQTQKSNQVPKKRQSKDNMDSENNEKEEKDILLRKTKKNPASHEVVILYHKDSYTKAVQVCDYLKKRGRISALLLPEQSNTEINTEEKKEVIQKSKFALLCLTNEFIRSEEGSDTLKLIDRYHIPMLTSKLESELMYEQSSLLDLMMTVEQQYDLETLYDEEMSRLTQYLNKQLHPDK